MTSPETSDRDLDPLERLWAEVLEHWDETSRHDAFLAACDAMGALAEAARRYRMTLEQGPARAEESRKRMLQIQFLATRSLDVAPPTPDTRPKRRLLTVIAALWMIGMLLYAYFVLSKL